MSDLTDAVKQMCHNHLSAIEAFLKPLVEAGAKPEDYELVEETRFDRDTNQMQQVYRLQKRISAADIVEMRIMQLEAELQVLRVKSQSLCTGRMWEARNNRDQEDFEAIQRQIKSLELRILECRIVSHKLNNTRG